VSTVFEEEIRSQGELLRRRAEIGFEQSYQVAKSFEQISYAVVAARGSSDNAAVFFQYLAGREFGLLVALATPSLYEGERAMRLDGAGVLALSQSGRTPGLVKVIEQATTQGCPRAVITNDASSPLAQTGALVIDLAVGQERAIASTKTFSATWHAVAQLVEALQGSALEGLNELPDLVDRTSEWALSTPLPASLLDAKNGLTVVGRGVGQAVAAEIALKIREVAGVRAESYAAADYLHGPIGADGDGSTLLLVVSDEVTDTLGTELLEECQRFGMRTVVLRSSNRSSFSCDEEIVLNESTPNWCLGLAEVVVGQVLALRVGELRGRPIDTSPGLKKITLSA
jgi:glutamine---fructose-6-phosphate transaminase (isomerizing)